MRILNPGRQLGLDWRQWLLLLAFCMWVVPALASDFRILKATTKLKEGTYLLDAQIEYAFSEAVLEALDNGVPLTLDLHVQIRRKGAWVWADSVIDRHLRFTIRYQPLSQRYLVAALPDGIQKSFVTRDAAITALGEIEGVPLVRQDQLESGQDYEVHIKTSLDIEALPLPLRPLAYLRPSWKLSSGWSEWLLKP